MERQFRCPSCGAQNTVTNPGILMRVCDYCKTAMYWDKESVLRAGSKSLDLPPSQRFKVGATGKLKGRSFRVLGRLSYAHENGTWDEWFIELDDGKIMWLTEDEGELFLESSLTLTSPAPPYEELQPGMQVQLNDKVGIIEELGEAKCIGGEGEIPFQVEIGETYPYADGSTPDGTVSFGLEYDPRTGNVEAYLGRILGLKEGRAKREDRGEAPERVGEIIRCTSCGKPYEGPRVQSTTMVVCDSCGSALELDEAEAKVVGKNVGKPPIFTFRIGLPITIEGTRYEVMGRMVYEEVEEQIPYTSMEYVLYNPESGYLWLSEYRGHYTVSRVMHSRIVMPPIPLPKMKVQVGSETFRVYERGEVTLRWVDGALPWTAKVGEKTLYAHLIKPPDYVDQEITGAEVELFRGRYLGHDELRAGLSDDETLPEPRGVYSCQPFQLPSWLQGTGRIAGAFLALNIVLFLASFALEKNTPVLRETITAEQYTQEHLTKPFQVPRAGAVMRVSGSAPLNNSWLALDFAVVNAEEQVLSEFDGEASFYHGRDSEGSWTEGSSSFSSYFKVKNAGTYRLLIHGQGGSGYSGPPRNESLNIVVTADNTISSYFFVPMILAGLIVCIGPALAWSFEARRWAEVIDDSDDSDD